jgi:hypothetical protein
MDEGCPQRHQNKKPHGHVLDQSRSSRTTKARKETGALPRPTVCFRGTRADTKKPLADRRTSGMITSLVLQRALRTPQQRKGGSHAESLKRRSGRGGLVWLFGLGGRRKAPAFSLKTFGINPQDCQTGPRSPWRACRSLHR